MDKQIGGFTVAVTAVTNGVSNSNHIDSIALIVSLAVVVPILLSKYVII